MEKADKHIYPVFNKILSRADKENLLKQTAKVIWLTGLSGSGKTTIAKGIEQVLQFQDGFGISSAYLHVSANSGMALMLLRFRIGAVLGNKVIFLGLKIENLSGLDFCL